MTEEQIKTKAKEQFPNDEFKQQIVIDAINWATKELQEENFKLEAKVRTLEIEQNYCLPNCSKIANLEAQIEKMKSALIDIKSNTDDVNIEWQIKYLFDELEIKEK